jgi:hypothetical protein
MMVQWGFPVKHKESKPQGYWVPYAWAVRLTVENMGGGRIVSKAVRMILRRAGIPVTKENEESLRVRYHAVCKQPWPPEMEGLVKRREKVKGFFDEPEPAQSAQPAPEPAQPEPPESPESPEPAPEPAQPDFGEEDFLDPELRAELERELSEGYIPDIEP